MGRQHATADRTARFWVWHGAGWVKLSLRPGQELSACEGGPHEEGYSYTYTTWTHEGDHVMCRSDTQARDCDGRLDRHEAVACPLDQLAAWLVAFDGDGGMVDDPADAVGPVTWAPRWHRVRSSQRDYTAEAAGY